MRFHIFQISAKLYFRLNHEILLHTCLNCGNNFEGKYCNLCGEKVYTAKDKSVSHIFEEGFHFITHLEGSFFKTLKYLLTRPGKLSEEYCLGRRKSLFKPISLFLLLVLIYLLFPYFEGLNMRLHFYYGSDFYGDYAFTKAAAVKAAHNWNEAQLADIFHAKAEKVSKLMLLILLPLTAFFFWLFTFKKRPLFFDQMIFATEINSVFLIWGFMVLPILVNLYMRIGGLITGTMPPVAEMTIGLIMYALLLIYLFFAAKRFYRINPWQATGLSILFFFAHFMIVQVIYKFLLFVITMALLG